MLYKGDENTDSRKQQVGDLLVFYGYYYILEISSRKASTESNSL